MDFKLVSKYEPMGDQPQAIDKIVKAYTAGGGHCTLKGVTGSGKTFTVANIIAKLNQPTLVLSHNKTLAAQLYRELQAFFPDNAVEYFISYYDYYQPEVYLPITDTYIEKDLAINEEIERMRLKTTTTLLSGRRDVIVVSSVSCLFGIGNPADFYMNSISLEVGDIISYKHLLYRLVEALYTRTEHELTPATFRVMGDTVDIMTAVGNACYRITFFDNEIEAIHLIDPHSGHKLDSLPSVTIMPSNIFMTSKERIETAIEEIKKDLKKQIAMFEREDRLVEAKRIKQRVEYDIEMIKELGYCPGIENYSRYFDGRKEGERPFCLLDYFPRDMLLVVDESHVTIPQIRAMYGGDSARKENLVEYGFRLPAARDNRPLTFAEFDGMVRQVLYVSATPADYELIRCEDNTFEQVVRPTGLVDPPMEVRIAANQIDNLLEEINKTVAGGDKVIVTTITKRMAEELSKYLEDVGVRSRYIHSDVSTLDRVAILNELREGKIDVLIGVNLLREGIDLPMVSLVAIIDADKEGLLRNARTIIQIAGRAARHASGRVIMYAENVTDSMMQSINEANRHREVQTLYNLQRQITPTQAAENTPVEEDIIKVEDADIQDNYEAQVLANMSRGITSYAADTVMRVEPNLNQLEGLINEAKMRMELAARNLDFIEAARQRDIMYEMQRRRNDIDEI